jgi:hypothetical protein
MNKKDLENAFKELGIVLYDDLNKEPFVNEQIIDEVFDFANSKKTKEEFVEAVDTIRFIDAISDKDAIEVYGQYRKTLEKHKNRLLVFCKNFNILDFEAFKKTITKQYYPEEFYNDQLRTKILEEQNSQCALCNKVAVDGIDFHLHHINYKKDDCNEENLIWLCAHCHGKTGTNREYWEKALSKKKQNANKFE